MLRDNRREIHHLSRPDLCRNLLQNIYDDQVDVVLRVAWHTRRFRLFVHLGSRSNVACSCSSARK